MARRTIYCDVDGVVADWEGRAMDVYGVKNDFVIRKYLKGGGRLVDKFCDLRERIAEFGPEFWSGIEPFWWAKDLCDRLDKLGDFAFLTSSGNHNKRPVYAAGGAYGKLIWISENFNGRSVSISRDKYIHAHNGAILIDDDKKNIDNFIRCGGHGFLFPHPYRIEDGEIDFEDVYKNIEREVRGV